MFWQSTICIEHVSNRRLATLATRNKGDVREETVSLGVQGKEVTLAYLDEVDTVAVKQELGVWS